MFHGGFAEPWRSCASFRRLVVRALSGEAVEGSYRALLKEQSTASGQDVMVLFEEVTGVRGRRELERRYVIE